MSILDDILVKKRQSLAPEMQNTSMAMLEKQIATVAPPRGFAAAIARTANTPKMGIIAEIKKGSPSKGLIRADFNPAQHAADYQRGGANCLSVLTDSHFFGSDADFTAARSASQLPMLRKDFMIEPWQILQSRQMGADCVLLILAILNDVQALALVEIAKTCHLDVLVETHNQDEMYRALLLPDFCMIGINNRNLHTFQTDLSNTESLIQSVTNERIVISESGISTPDDIKRLARAGAKGVLIGEQFMRQNDIAKAVSALRKK